MQLSQTISELFKSLGFPSNLNNFSVPPKPEMGDLSFTCFSLVKEMKKNPAELAREIKAKIEVSKDMADGLIARVEVLGPYVNFFLNARVLASEVLLAVAAKDFGASKTGKGKKIMVEFAQPNTHKPLHIGHLRNITTGESLSRIFENSGYKVIRANFQGDVGLHIAKFFYGIFHSLDEYEAIKSKSITDKAAFLGRIYALGGQAYEADENAKKEIVALNEKIYSGTDKTIKKIYNETRKWSLEYFDYMYHRLGTHFDRLYFESETFAAGKKLVLENLSKGIFKESQGAVIFEGEKFGLHNRVFLNSKGLPTYEAKDLALAKLQLKEKPEKIFHVVGKEQTEYFKVVFKAVEEVFSMRPRVENHLMYGWVTLKEGKMSSRTGNVILAEWLLDEVKKKISAVMSNHDLADKEKVMEKVAVAAVKYSFLRTAAVNDIAFDINESISLTGDSGPYLLYIVARIRSIFKKLGKQKIPRQREYNPEPTEKSLLFTLSNFPTVAIKASEEHDPSKIAHYLLDLAQNFNNFYSLCPVLKAEDTALSFRLDLIKAVERVMERGLYLLGIDVVDEM